MLIGEKTLIDYWGGSRKQRIAIVLTGGKSFPVAYWGEEPYCLLGRVLGWGHASEHYWISGSGSPDGVSRDTVSRHFDVIGNWSIVSAQSTIECIKPATGV